MMSVEVTIIVMPLHLTNNLTWNMHTYFVFAFKTNCVKIDIIYFKSIIFSE